MKAAGFPLKEMERSAMFSGILRTTKTLPRTLGLALSELRGEESAPSEGNPAIVNYFVPAEAKPQRDTYAAKKQSEMRAVLEEGEATLKAQGVFVRGAQRNYNSFIRYVKPALYFIPTPCLPGGEPLSSFSYLVLHADTSVEQYHLTKRIKSCHGCVPVAFVQMCIHTPYCCRRLLGSEDLTKK